MDTEALAIQRGMRALARKRWRKATAADRAEAARKMVAGRQARRQAKKGAAK